MHSIAPQLSHRLWQRLSTLSHIPTLWGLRPHPTIRLQDEQHKTCRYSILSLWWGNGHACYPGEPWLTKLTKYTFHYFSISVNNLASWLNRSYCKDRLTPLDVNTKVKIATSKISVVLHNYDKQGSISPRNEFVRKFRLPINCQM